MPTFAWYVIVTAAVLFIIWMLVQLGVFSGGDDPAGEAALAVALLRRPSSPLPMVTVRTGVLEVGD